MRHSEFDELDRLIERNVRTIDRIDYAFEIALAVALVAALVAVGVFMVRVYA